MNVIETISYEELTNELKRIKVENISLQNKIAFVEMDNDLARRTVSEYAEELVRTQHKFKKLTNNIQYLCTYQGLQNHKKIKLIGTEVENAVTKGNY